MECDIYQTAVELRLLIILLHKLEAADQVRHLQPHQLGGRLQYGVLAMLHNRAQTLRELSDHMLVEPATLVPVVNRLERDGFVRRGTDPNDRRRSPISLTDHGLETLRQVSMIDPDGVYMQAVAALSPAQRQSLINLLGELCRRLGGEEPVNRVAQIAHHVTQQTRHFQTGAEANSGD